MSEKMKKDQLTKVNDKTFSITEEPIVRNVNINMLKRQRAQVAARLAHIDALIAEAAGLGVE